jgi:hypothetical protein
MKNRRYTDRQIAHALQQAEQGHPDHRGLPPARRPQGDVLSLDGGLTNPVKPTYRLYCEEGLRARVRATEEAGQSAPRAPCRARATEWALSDGPHVLFCHSLLNRKSGGSRGNRGSGSGDPN